MIHRGFIGWKQVEQQPLRVKKKALDPAKLSLPLCRLGSSRDEAQASCRSHRVVHKVKSVFSSPHVFVFAIMNCNCTSWLVLLTVIIIIPFIICVSSSPPLSFFDLSLSLTHTLSLSYSLTLSFSKTSSSRLNQG